MKASREPGDRIWAKPSLSLGVPSVEFFSTLVFPEFSVHPKPNSKFSSTVPKGTTQESTPYPSTPSFDLHGNISSLLALGKGNSKFGVFAYFRQ